MVEASLLQRWPASLKLFLAFGFFVSLLAVPVFFFAGTMAAIDGPNIISSVLIAVAVLSGLLAVGGPAIALWFGKSPGNMRRIWCIASVTAVPAILVVPLLWYLSF